MKTMIQPAWARAVVALALAASIPVHADGTPDLISEIEAMKEQMRQQKARLEAQQERIERQQTEIDRLRGAESNADTWVAERRADEVRAIVHEVLADAETRTDLFEAGGLMPVYDRGFVLRSADGNYRLHLGGWIQPRYEFTKRTGADAEGDENRSSFLLRRVRLDVRGHVFSPQLTYRIMPELARTANLRDGWINYEFSREIQVRFGQFTVPFQWHRYVGPRRQHFSERSNTSETFGFPTGRDIGVAIHGQNEDSTLGWAVGLFDGAGRNVALSDSAGHMASARLTMALLGTLPREESDLRFSEEPQLAIGGGIQGAGRNQARAWDLGRSPEENPRADWLSATADARFAWKGFSLAAEGYLRRVRPDDAAVDDYTGAAWGVTGGFFIIPQACEIVGRYNWLRLDVDDPATRETEWGFGLNVYHRGHDWKTRLNFLSHTTDGLAEQRIILEHHLQF